MIRIKYIRHIICINYYHISAYKTGKPYIYKLKMQQLVVSLRCAWFQLGTLKKTIYIYIIFFAQQALKSLCTNSWKCFKCIQSYWSQFWNGFFHFYLQCASDVSRLFAEPFLSNVFIWQIYITFLISICVLWELHLRLPALFFTSRCITNHLDYKKSIEVNDCVCWRCLLLCVCWHVLGIRRLSWNNLCKVCLWVKWRKAEVRPDLRKAGSLLMSDAVIYSAVTLILILPGKVPSQFTGRSVI